MNTPALTTATLDRLRDCYEALQVAQQFDLLGVDHPLATLVIANHLESRRQRAVWSEARQRAILGRLGVTVEFDKRD